MVEYNFIELAKNAKLASKKLATISTEIKNKALLSIAEALENNKDKIFKANPNATYDEIMSCKFQPNGPLNMPTLSSNDAHYLDEKIAFKHLMDNVWIQSYFPLLKKKGKILRQNENTGLMEEHDAEVVANPDYAKKFLSNFPRVKGIAKDLVGRVGNDHKAGGMLTVPAAQQLLKAEQNQLSSLFEGYRTASTGNAFKWDKEKKSIWKWSVL